MKALTIDWNLCGGVSGASNKGDGGVWGGLEGPTIDVYIESWPLLTRHLSVNELPRTIKFEL